MSLLTIEYEELFDIDTQLQGAPLLRNVDVDVDAGPPWYATVRREGNYQVIIDLDSITLGVCSCRAFVRSGPCKHMWATLCMLDVQSERPRTADRRPKARRSKAAARSRKSRVVQPLPQPVEAIGAVRLAQLARSLVRARVPAVDLLDHGRIDVRYLVPERAADDGGPGPTFVPVTQVREADGGFGTPTPLHVRLAAPDARLDSTSVERLARLQTSGRRRDLGRYVGLTLAPSAATAQLLRELVDAGVVDSVRSVDLVRGRSVSTGRVEVDAGPPVVFGAVRTTTANGLLELALRIEREDVPIPASKIQCIVSDDELLLDAALVRWHAELPHLLVFDLLQNGPIQVDATQAAQVDALLVPATLPVAPAPTPQFVMFESLLDAPRGKLIRGAIGFRYGAHGVDDPEVGVEIEAVEDHGAVSIDGVEHLRDVAAERAALRAFEAAGGVLHHEFDRPVASVPVADAVTRLRALAAAGFEVWAGGDRVRALRAPSIRVTSGVDWFEVETEVRAHDGTLVEVPELLGAMRDRQGMFVLLKQGEVGIVENDVQVLAALRRLGKSVDGRLRLHRSQGFLLDALLRSRDVAAIADAKFAAVQQSAARGLRVTKKSEPKGFGATLRDYQREGLGWFDFLRELGVGGCLADDMGLGKTVQVLALLEQERRRRPRPGPSLVVAPSSLVFHWQREAQRFAPKLRVLAFVGSARFSEHAAAVSSSFAEYDLVLTTYGTLRNDIDKYADVQWHYAVLDESQAIKNEQSQASKAARALDARHRLALSGTPIENHLGELWALFEFLNPGMLGSSKAFRELLAVGVEQVVATNDVHPAAPNPFTAALRSAVRPFLLRRTKAQVLTELPEKSVQVLYCELGAPQRRMYDELAAFYRARLLGEIADGDVPDELRFQVLEALLRLRQASCHPGLLDPAKAEVDCAKFDVLWPMLTELRAEGHKALVFSQFPSFLSLLRKRLDAIGVPYAYLDGQTRRRREQVDRFQTDPDCPLFLISLKAGGHGLNLTAASYVFVLDPWWNPAAEDQAIDRAHRIGQNRHVHAYRLICRDTVEQRVAELQERKRAIAHAVLGDDRSVLQELSAADVAALLA